MADYPKVDIEYSICDLSVEPDQEFEVHVGDREGNDIGFIKIHVTKNNKIVILAEGQYNDNNNIIFDQWQDSEDYEKKIKKIEEND